MALRYLSRQHIRLNGYRARLRMYKANRRDGLCERSLTMFPVGIDVSKNTLDLCMLYDGIKGRIKTRNIQNNRHSVENILRWLRLQHCSRKMFMW
jgi:hypothetical protein